MPEEAFSKLPGVIDTVVGYTGGSTPYPTYAAISDHTEALRVTYDPSRVSFSDILVMFWDEHQPMPASMAGTQYRSAIFVHTERQLAEVEAVRAKLQGQSPFATSVDLTAVEPASSFYRAEEYHQRFIAKQMGAW
mmetsp:Transcript_37888/g.64926  ORF Transcript_37888/g.64926 Transcript_37888/m.64926 type:complete len:135 (-) Transcript_37888:557-961(-)